MNIQSGNLVQLTTSDLEAHQEAVDPNQIRVDQLSQGSFSSRIDSIYVNQLFLYRERWNQRVRVTGSNPAGYILIGASALPGVVWRGEPLGVGQIAVNDASADMEFSTGSAADHFVLLAPADSLVNYIGEDSCEKLQRARRPLVGDQQATALLFGEMQRLIAKYTMYGDVLIDEFEGAAVEHELLNAVAEFYIDSGARPGRIAKPARRRALLRALEFSHDLQTPIRLPDLARAVGISQRNLEYAFQEAYGVTPVKYLRWTRMNHVRRLLHVAVPGSTTVSNVARHWGFSDMSHMAVGYRALFGESPSETLARSGSFQD
jgi:AraC family ethanolamine operon transcriptional activator